eukprot:TRINITY_DN4223_c0_g1_i3.p2 TRINITY_DN4223_c0_g1~~TRINITY_DN4223_c0_g1_i3.p2  ORF type:complete len:298 (+),score=56.16 TRINITY_DN4223_c0_g1_i3:270-1163(+)
MENDRGSSAGLVIWLEVTDPTSGKKFYADPSTGRCVWEKPSSPMDRIQVAEGTEWWELFDEKHQLPYYYNTVSQETIWEKPEGITPVPLYTLTQPYHGPSAEHTTPHPIVRSASISTSSPPTNDNQNNSNFGNSSLPHSSPTGLSSDPKLRNLIDSKEKRGIFGRTKKRASHRMSSPQIIPPRTRALTTTEDRPELPTDIKDEINKFQLKKYAEKYFETHKRGVFRRQVPIKELLMFQKEPLSQPLLRLPHHSDLPKTAQKIHKLILQYQGIRQAEKEELAIAQDVLAAGIFHSRNS